MVIRPIIIGALGTISKGSRTLIRNGGSWNTDGALLRLHVEELLVRSSQDHQKGLEYLRLTTVTTCYSRYSKHLKKINKMRYRTEIIIIIIMIDIYIKIVFIFLTVSSRGVIYISWYS